MKKDMKKKIMALITAMAMVICTMPLISAESHASTDPPLEALTARVAAVEKDVADLQSRDVEINASIKTLKESNEKLQEDLSKAQAAAEANTQKITGIYSDMGKLKDEVNKLASVVSTEDQKNAAAIQETKEELAAAKIELKAGIEKNDKAINESVTQIAKLGEEVKSLKTTSETLEASAEAHKMQIEEIKKEIIALKGKDEATDATVKTLETAVKTMQDSLDTCNSEIGEINTSIGEIELNLFDMGRDVEGLKTRTETLETDYTALSDRIDQVLAEANAYTDKRAAELQRQVDDLKAQMSIISFENKQVRITALKKSKKAFTVSYNAYPNADSYQIYYKDKASKKSKAKYATSTQTSLKVNKLKKNHKYTVKVRALKTINGTTIYSNWSKAKNVRVK